MPTTLPRGWSILCAQGRHQDEEGGCSGEPPSEAVRKVHPRAPVGEAVRVSMSRSPVVIARKGDRWGWWDDEAGRFTPASPGVTHQLRCSANVAEREARSWYVVVGVV